MRKAFEWKAQGMKNDEVIKINGQMSNLFIKDLLEIQQFMYILNLRKGEYYKYI